MMRWLIRLTLAAVVVAAALAPLPSGVVERVYSAGLYARMQPVVTSASNAVPVALLDVGVGILLLLGVVTTIRAVRKRGVLSGAMRGLVWLVTTVAVVYLLFLGTWGLNYRRVTLETRLDFDRQRINEAAAAHLASTAIDQVNAGHATAHAQPFSSERLYRALDDVQISLGTAVSGVRARPKRSLGQIYFRQAAIDGMTVPVFLEVILHPDLVPVEVPFVLAHEQAHIAGFADESEANFLAWLACIRSDDPVARYSGWLDAYRYAVQVLPPPARSRLPRLESGPREDLRQIAARLGRSSPRVRTVARDVYDSYLKANRIEEGIANYGRVLQLVLGTQFDDRWTPRLRPLPADPR